MFGQYYSENHWGNSETVSGNGSTLEQTQVVRSVLPTLLADLGVSSLLDLPCGDFYWMRHLPQDYPQLECRQRWGSGFRK